MGYRYALEWLCLPKRGEGLQVQSRPRLGGHASAARSGRAQRLLNQRLREALPGAPGLSTDRMMRTGTSLRDTLSTGVWLCDGAMGTLLYASSGLDSCFDALNLSEPALVRSVHAKYIAAGADLIETNTFGANRFKLAPYGVQNHVVQINRSGAVLAREAADRSRREVWVLGAMGPLGRNLAPLGSVSPDDARSAFREQATALVETGVDAFVLETFSNLVEISLAIEAVRSIADLPIIAQMAFTDERVTFAGRTPGDVAQILRTLPVEVVGANCSVGPTILCDVLEQMQPVVGALPLSAQPNAGFPRQVGERIVYVASPAYMAQSVARMIQVGARVIGGCCGTTPEHIAAMRQAIDTASPAHRQPATHFRAPVIGPTPTANPWLQVPRTPLQRKLDRGEFVITVELDPPRGHSVEHLVQGAKILRDRGVDLVDINDGSLGRVSMGVLPTAVLIRERTGLDVNMHFTCRDRNLLGIQADLLGAHALDIRNILALKGDPPRSGDYARATAVFDVGAVGLIEVVRRLNEGLDAAGNRLGEPTAFSVGAALNPVADDPEREIRLLRRKVSAGAQWLQTQPVYDLEALDRFLSRAGGCPVPLIVGVLPLHSARHADFLHNEVPGIRIPEAIRARMRQASERALAVGIETAQQLVQEIRRRYAGVYLMPSFGRFDVVAEVLDAFW